MFRFLVLFVSLYSISSSANESERYRDLFLKAEKQIWKSNSSTYQSLYDQLGSYPLKPYLDQKRLMNRMRLSSVKQIAEFLDKYQGTPLDWPLRKKWLNYLVKRNRQSLFLAFFQPTSNVELTCYNYQYLLNKGADPKPILAKVDRLWIVGQSQPKACDPLFKQWQEAGLRTDVHVWNRLAKAADGGNHTLIPYITSLLPEDEKYLGKFWHKVRRDPAVITKLSRFPTKSEKEAQIFTYGIKRLIWRDPNRALKTYHLAIKEFSLTQNQQDEIAYKFALALASKKHTKASEWLSKVADSDISENIVQWKIAEVLRQQDWQMVIEELRSLPEKLHKSNQWQYWYARSLLATEREQEGQKILNILASKRHYYGFLAAGLLGQPLNLQNSPLDITSEEKLTLFNDTAGKRAFELFHIGRLHQARKEWNYWLTLLDQRQKLVAAKLANEIGWYDRPIFALSQVGYLDDVDLRFPLAYNDQIKQYSNKHSIDPAWTFAITRRESSFMEDAHSSVGAKGLMQVMPGTAKILTQRKEVSSKYLLDSSNNINLGTQYLKDLLKRHDGNQILATAAYNAGPYRVKKWLKTVDEMPADIWIETIPFKETRDYVKSVLAYQQIYQHKVGQPDKFFEQVHRMSISRL